MPHTFDDAALHGVLTHMNGDHSDDNLLIVRAFAHPDAVSATMTGFDGDGGDWEAVLADGSASAVRVPWRGGPISERPQVRRAVVEVYAAACETLGIPARNHQ
ncbi:hypothetical protein LK09_01280 [Microbacterium mangrovi]|uniref:DUF2470 domain-containing protein n=1 Tax=Microbacterium mangrovi TaxID=1348253 RepID=A0A0B2ADQ9_9MICO|nr:DUF2470 domain-containing protein [Microbacterium mangrovi]KHK99977.1 hypothetical protein LK09_01280 [Microbacterium mangrovi]